MTPRAAGAVRPWQLPSWAVSPTGQRAASIAARATSGLVTCRQFGMATSSFSPLLVVICWTGVGAQYLPSAASVAYAFAISSGVEAETPRVNEPQSLAFLVAISSSFGDRKCTPKRWATLTTLSAPTLSSSGTKYVLTEAPNPVHMLYGPFSLFDAFVGQ